MATFDIASLLRMATHGHERRRVIDDSGLWLYRVSSLLSIPLNTRSRELPTPEFDTIRAEQNTRTPHCGLSLSITAHSAAERTVIARQSLLASSVTPACTALCPSSAALSEE